jgi:hypothetical protein
VRHLIMEFALLPVTFFGKPSFLLKGLKMKDGNKIQTRDDKLLSKEKTWRRARVVTVILAVVWLLILFVGFSFSSISGEEKKAFFFWIGWVLFWLLLIDWLNMRIRHIDSIKYYRRNEKS